MVRPKPLEGECFGGYVVRLAHSNGYKNVTTFGRQYFNVSRYQWYKIPLRTLSDLTEIEDKHRENLWLNYHLTYGYSYQGVSIPDIMVSVGKKFCAQCLREDGIRRAQWNLGIIPICFKHKTLLSVSCSKCTSRFANHDSVKCSCIADGLKNTEWVSDDLVERVSTWEKRLVNSKGDKSWKKRQLEVLNNAFLDFTPSKYGRHYSRKTSMPKLPRYPFTVKQTIEIHDRISEKAA